MKLKAEYKNGTLELSDIFEEGGTTIRVERTGKAKLYEIPQYGGDERYVGEYNSVCDALDVAAKMT